MSKKKIISSIEDFRPYTIIDALSIFTPYLTSLILFLLVASLLPIEDSDTGKNLAYALVLIITVLVFYFVWFNAKKNHSIAIVPGFRALDNRIKEQREKIVEYICGNNKEITENIANSTIHLDITQKTSGIDIKNFSFALKDGKLCFKSEADNDVSLSFNGENKNLKLDSKMDIHFSLDSKTELPSNIREEDLSLSRKDGSLSFEALVADKPSDSSQKLTSSNQ